MQAFLRRHQPVRAEQAFHSSYCFFSISQVNLAVFGRSLVKQHCPQIFRKFSNNLLNILAACKQGFQKLQRFRHIAFANSFYKFPQGFAPYNAQHAAHGFSAYAFCHNAALVQKAQCIAHTAVSLHGNQLQGVVISRNAAAVGNFTQAFNNVSVGYALKIKALAA